MTAAVHYNFAFRIRYIHAALPAHIPHESNITVGNHFRPPTNKRYFVQDQSRYFLGDQQFTPDQTFIWKPGEVTPTQQHFPLYQTRTLFWCNDRSGYLVVPFDCTRQDVEPYPDHRVHLFDSEDEGPLETNTLPAQNPGTDSIPLSWRRMTFARNEADISFSRVGYNQEHFRLGARVPDTWNNVLVPPTQSIQIQNGNLGFGPRCRLAGDLGFLVGLCAFTSSIPNTPQTVQDSFRPHQGSTEWCLPHDSIPFHERSDDRGVIVDIYRDVGHDARQRLKQWEDGDFGPILT